MSGLVVVWATVLFTVSLDTKPGPTCSMGVHEIKTTSILANGDSNGDQSAFFESNDGAAVGFARSRCVPAEYGDPSWHAGVRFPTIDPIGKPLQYAHGDSAMAIEYKSKEARSCFRHRWLHTRSSPVAAGGGGIGGGLLAVFCSCLGDLLRVHPPCSWAWPWPCPC
jgi:hypothetical protein